jgi:hypothetical protein
MTEASWLGEMKTVRIGRSARLSSKCRHAFATCLYMALSHSFAAAGVRLTQQQV